MGVYDPSGPPSGGKVVFEVLLVRDWLDAHFEGFADMAIKTFFRYVAGSDPPASEAARWTRHYRNVMADAVVRNSVPMRFQMTWAQELNRKTLYLGVYNRLCILHNAPIWKALSDAERVEHAYRIAWFAHLRCATVRSAAYAGVPITAERPYVALDAAKRQHYLDVGIIPVTTYGNRDR